MEAEVKALLQQLRAERVPEVHPDLVDLVEITNAGDVQPMPSSHAAIRSASGSLRAQ